MSQAPTITKAIGIVKETAVQYVNGYHISENDKVSYKLALSVLKDLEEKL